VGSVIEFIQRGNNQVSYRTALVGVAGLALTVGAGSAHAQFSSDIPGVPRAAISIRGGKQARTEWTFTGGKAAGAVAGQDSISGGIRLGFGRSYRIGSQFEVGYDFTFIDGVFVQPPKGTGTGAAAAAQSYTRALAGYGIKVGGKFRAYSALDPDGNGLQVSIGGALQPALKTLYGFEKLKDSTRTGSQFSNKETTAPSAVFRTNPFAKLRSSTMLAVMGSYRSRRLLGDAALMTETVGAQDASGDPSPTQTYNGLSIRLGGAYRVTRGFAVGASTWGNGAPPWRDEVRLSVPGKVKAEKYALLLQFGSTPEAGVDLMLTSPTGSFAESARLYVRARSTR
jgi:hypothetical protein